MTRRFTPPTPGTDPPRNPDDLVALAHRVERLTISRTNPEAFFEERSEIAHAMRRLAGTTRQPRRDHNSAGQPRVTGERGKVQCSLD